MSTTERPPATPSEPAAKTSLLRPLVEDLHARREQIKLGGGEEKIARQHAAEKLTARERLRAADRRRARSPSSASTGARTSPSARWTARTRRPTA